jgi:iron(III) transport system ATP-binding protein
VRLPRRRQATLPVRHSGPDHPAVECRGLSKRFGNVDAVADVSLQVPRGEIVALLGPSGCGKTTFLRLVAGFERPDAGSIALGGRSVAGNGSFIPPERRHVAIVFQDYALFPHLCVADNVGYGISGPGCDARVREVVHLVGLTGVGDRFPHELSGGQQQRVALARALAPRPDIILFDEPFSSLDAALRAKMRDEVRTILHEAEATAIFVTHDQEEALSLADRVGIMREGRIHQIDTPERVYTRPADPFVAAFVGGANLVRATGDGEHVTCAFGTFRPLNTPPSGPTILVVRPESLHIRHDAGSDAVVTEATYYGHDQLVELRLGNGEIVRSRLGTSRFFEAGDHVTTTVAGDEVIAFPTV